MKVADTVAFTISIEFEDIANKFPKLSEQFKKKEIKKKNEDLQKEYNITNNLENPVEKNQYRVSGKP
jgi:flagellin-specific chaperone FliS